MWAAFVAQISGFFTKIWGYVALVGVVLSMFLATYLKGKRDSKNENTIQVQAEDLDNRRQAEDVRRDVAAEPNTTERLRRWQRPGP